MGSEQTKHSKSNQNAAASQNTTNGQENVTSPQGSSQSLGKKVLSELSGAQITASVLAAVTALLFSSNIGIAGSVIGVAVSAGITALSSSIYKSFIEGTKQKMQQQVGAVNNDTNNAKNGVANDTASSPTNNIAEEKKSNTNAAHTEPTDRSTSGYNASAEKTQETEEIKRVVYSHNKDAFNPSNNKYTHEQAKRSQPKTSRLTELLRNKWFALVVFTVIALVSVLVTSHIITAATSGEGIGTKPQPIFVSNTHNQSESSSTNATESTADHSATGANDNDSSTNRNSQSQSSTSQAQSSSSSKTAGNASSSSSASSSQQSSASDVPNTNAAAPSSSSGSSDAKTPSANDSKSNNA